MKKDLTAPPTLTRKKIMFYDSEERQTKLRIRCQYDGMSQSQFFRMMITGYLESDPLIYDYIKKCKEKYEIQGVNKINKIDRLNKLASEKKNKFALNETEIEDIFDLIEVDSEI